MRIMGDQTDADVEKPQPKRKRVGAARSVRRCEVRPNRPLPSNVTLGTIPWKFRMGDTFKQSSASSECAACARQPSGGSSALWR